MAIPFLFETRCLLSDNFKEKIQMTVFNSKILDDRALSLFSNRNLLILKRKKCSQLINGNGLASLKSSFDFSFYKLFDDIRCWPFAMEGTIRHSFDCTIAQISFLVSWWRNASKNLWSVLSHISISDFSVLPTLCLKSAENFQSSENGKSLPEIDRWNLGIGCWELKT